MSTVDKWNPPDAVPGKAKYILRNVGPNAIYGGVAMGAGTISSLVIAGSSLEYSVGWLILISGLLAAVVLYVGGKVSVLTGETPFETISRYTHPVFTFALLIGLGYAYYYLLMIQGVVLEHATEVLLPASFAPYVGQLIIPAALLLFATLIVINAFDTTEAVMTAFIGVMLLLFLVNVLVIQPDLGSVASGVVPGEIIGEQAGLTAAAGVIGGAIGIGPIWYAYITYDADWNEDNIPAMAWDNLIFLGIAFSLFSFIIYISAAATLGGATVEGAQDAAVALEPVAGFYAAIIFTIGLWTAAMSSIVGMSLLMAYLVGDLINNIPGLERNIELRLSERPIKLLTLFGFLLAAIGPILDGLPPLPFVAFGVSLLTLVAPATIAVYGIANLRKADVGEHTATWYTNLGLALALVVTLYSAYLTGTNWLVLTFSALVIIAISSYVKINITKSADSPVVAD